MRRSPILLAVGLVIVLGGSVATGASTQNLTLNAVVAEATWDSYNPDTGTGEYGGVQVAREGRVTMVIFQRSIGELVLCEGELTPGDASDDFYGFVGTEIYGEGPATLSMGRQYTSAKASGTVTADVMTFNECTGDFGSSVTKTFKITMALTAVSPLIKETSRTHLRVPGELTSHSMVRGTFRMAAGSVKVGGLAIDADALIGQLTYRVHETSH